MQNVFLCVVGKLYFIWALFFFNHHGNIYKVLPTVSHLYNLLIKISITLNKAWIYSRFFEDG